MIKKDDIKFLKQLQKEMITQDTVSQADPRFWVVKGTIKEFGYDSGYADGGVIVLTCQVVIADTMEAFKFLKKNSSYIFSYNKKKDSINVSSINGKICSLDTLEDICGFIEQNNIGDVVNDEYPYIINYKNVSKIFENTFFLTNRECKEHISRNHYHYPKDAHPYAMTAWRSPQVENLFKIIQETDWSVCNER